MKNPDVSSLIFRRIEKALGGAEVSGDYIPLKAEANPQECLYLNCRLNETWKGGSRHALVEKYRKMVRDVSHIVFDGGFIKSGASVCLSFFQSYQDKGLIRSYRILLNAMEWEYFLKNGRWEGDNLELLFVESEPETGPQAEP